MKMVKVVFLFIIGALLTFEVSIVDWLKKAKPEIRIERRKRFAVTDKGVVEVSDDEEEDATPRRLRRGEPIDHPDLFLVTDPAA